MAGIALNNSLTDAIATYSRGDSTIDDLWSAALAHLESEQVDHFLQAIPSDAAAPWKQAPPWLAIP